VPASDWNNPCCARYSQGSAPFHGAIDEVEIFDRALDPSGISAIYLGTTAVEAVPSLSFNARVLAFVIIVLLFDYGVSRVNRSSLPG
jgi:hypothetical protein